MKRLSIASDHAGYELKSALIPVLEQWGFEVTNYGADTTESVDYPDYVHALAASLKDEKSDMGIIICGSGNGVNMTANRYPFIRSGLAWNKEVGALIRQHNNANVLALPARYITLEEAKEIAHAFLFTTFDGGRHQRRIEKIDQHA